MRLSHCIFYTGALGAAFPDPSAARDAADELFTHSDGLSEAFFRELASYGVVLPKPPVRVITISPGPGDAFTMDTARQFADTVQQWFTAHFPFDGLFYYVNSRIQGAASVSGDAQMDEVYRLLRQLVSGFPEQGRPHVAISNAYDSLQAISRACVENEEARVFERFLEKPIDVLVQPGDFRLFGAPQPNTDDDTFFGDVSQRICNAMLLGDRTLMHRALDDALNFMVGRFPRVSAVHMRAIHFCKPLEMNLVGADLIDRLFVQQFRLVQKVIETDNERELRQTFHARMDEMWDYSVARKTLRHGALMHRVVEYIERNLRDSTLSLPTIAENFQLPEAKLSADFRQYYRETIPNFIHQRRVAYIKEQLRTTKTPIRIIALDAGYISIATMNRAFFRQEGIYPGQYRKNFSDSQSSHA